jgi:hypothetical protein
MLAIGGNLVADTLHEMSVVTELKSVVGRL